ELQFRCEWCGNHDLFSRAGVNEGKTPSVQELPSKNRKFGFVDDELRGRAVKRIADNGMSEGGEVHANLMRPPGVELDFHQRGRAEFLQSGPVRARRPGVERLPRGTSSHTHAAFRIARNRKVNAAFCCRESSLYKRQIGFLNSAGAERFGKLRVGKIVFCDENRATRVLVQAMYDSGAQEIDWLRESLPAAKQRVNKRPA